MSKRDRTFLLISFALLSLLFSPVLLPGRIPGNFGDIFFYHYPLRHLIVSTLQEGRLPLWDPYIFAGMPLAANPQAVLFYPGSLLHSFFPLAWALGLDVFLHAALAGAGAYLLARKWSVDGPGAWALSFSYGLSPFLVCRIAQGVPTHLASLAWAPWIWLAAGSSSPLLLGLTLALQILSGHPQFCLVNFMALGLWTALKSPPRVLFLIQAGALGTLIAAIQVLPTLEFLGHSVRAHWISAYSSGYSLKPAYLLTLISPGFFGDPLKGNFGGYPSEFFEMFRLYIGIIPLALALAGLVRNKALWALLGAGIFLALGQNNPAYGLLQRGLGLDFLRVPARFSFFILWALWMAASAGWNLLRRAADGRTRAILAAVTALDLMLWTAPWVYAQKPGEALRSDPALIEVLRKSPGRIATAPDIPTADKSRLYRIPNATGYEAFYLADIARYTTWSEGAPAADGSRTYIRKWDTPFMGSLGVRYYISPAPAAPVGRGSPSPLRLSQAYLYENPRATPLVRGAGSWAILSPEHWIARGDGPSDVLISQINYPGWKAWVNGRRLRFGSWQGVLPAARVEDRGPWTLHFRFLPWLWFLGAWMSLAALALAALRAAP